MHPKPIDAACCDGRDPLIMGEDCGPCTSSAVSEIREYCAESFLIPLGFSVVKMYALKRPINLS